MSRWLRSGLQDLLMSVTAAFLLSSLGAVVTVQAQDCSRPVGGANMQLKGSDILLSSFLDGTKVTFACDVGYRTAGGSASITCTAGSWSTLSLTCTKKNCGSAGELENGSVDYPDGTEFGAKAVFRCKPGFNLAGKAELICGDQGWMGRAPLCEALTCDPPPAIGNGSFRPVKEYYEYSDVIQYFCRNDFTLVGSKSVTCSEDETFKPASPKCIMVECEDPVIDNGRWYGGSTPPHRYRATVTMQCDPDHDMLGSASITCEINGEWSPGLPVCTRKGQPTKPTTTRTSTKSPPSTKEPKDEANNLPLTLGLVFGVLVIVIAVIVCCCCGVPGFCKRKRGFWRGNTDMEATKDGEDVALS